MKSLLRWLCLAVLALTPFGVAAQGQTPPSGFVAPSGAVGKKSDGSWVFVQLDANGNMLAAAAGSTLFTQGQSPPSGYVATYAIVGQKPDGTWAFLQLDANGNLLTSGSGGGHTIEDEGVPLTQRSVLNFVGNGIVCADSGGKTVCTVTGAVTALDDLSDVTITSARKFNILSTNDGVTWINSMPGITVNAQTGVSYTISENDRGSLVTFANASAVAATLPQANSTGFDLSFWTYLKNKGAGLVTLTPTTSTINGATELKLPQYNGAFIFSDNTNYWALLYRPNKVWGCYIGADNGSALVDADDMPSCFANLLQRPITITQVWCECDAGSPTVQLQRDDGTPTNMLTSNLTCGSTAGTTTGFVSGENTISDTQRVDALVVAAGGTAKRITVFFAFTEDQ